MVVDFWAGEEGVLSRGVQSPRCPRFTASFSLGIHAVEVSIHTVSLRQVCIITKIPPPSPSSVPL